MRNLCAAAAVITSGINAVAQELPIPEKLFPELSNLIAAAEAHAPSLRVEQFSAEEARANEQVVARADDLRVNLHTRIGAEVEQRIGSELENDQDLRLVPYVNLNAVLPVYHWGAFEAQQEIAALRRRLLEASAERMALLVKQEVRRYYLHTLLAQQAARIAEDDVVFADRLLKGQKALLESGQIARSHVLETEIFRLEREEALKNAEKQVQFMQSMLKELTGLEKIEITPRPIPTFEAIDSADAERFAQRLVAGENIPELEALQLQVDAEKANFDYLKTSTRPKLDLVASTYVDSVDEYKPSSNRYELTPRVIGFAGIMGTWNIFDSGETKSRLLASKARQRRAEAQMDQRLGELRREASQLLQELELNATQMDSRSRRVELLEASVELLERQRESDAAPVNLLLERKIQLEQTRLNLFNSRVSYLLNLSQLINLAAPQDL